MASVSPADRVGNLDDLSSTNQQSVQWKNKVFELRLTLIPFSLLRIDTISFQLLSIESKIENIPILYHAANSNFCAFHWNLTKLNFCYFCVQDRSVWCELQLTSTKPELHKTTSGCLSRPLPIHLLKYCHILSIVWTSTWAVRMHEYAMTSISPTVALAVCLGTLE